MVGSKKERYSMNWSCSFFRLLCKLYLHWNLFVVDNNLVIEREFEELESSFMVLATDLNGVYEYVEVGLVWDYN